ncbi:ubiquitin-protein ligase TUL1 KNAG_0A07090 [Huiozyma naganishii CBS 8797]|uniref:RING-type E3 ubiquitin transferase n=1 Tax=Huiozyma naganishii (strain ATCC MYA-139 / BCRC 22969 / CBS 8797 / KCTC 17520 / NBRC 10181 / NCYC 3082 / Yp74L-3) TaxID=1071383 RepID=J7RFP2_HUIN7|nr:hypothetical protein KNAG_0A07090 [Kazachstania naganishii CBS 8797]CCK68363.1 hypothetical protein KNAG_0A07090 [Kazachstania naganishii CBS 8797]
MEIDGNTLLFIIIVFYIFFSSPGGDGVSSTFEFNQMKILKETLDLEYQLFNNMTYDSNFKNITGLKLSYQDILDNPDQNATFPLPNKNYNSWNVGQSHMLLPDKVINYIQDEVWNISELENKNNVFPFNISSSLRGTTDLISNHKYEKIRMPIPNFYKTPSGFSVDQPELGDDYSAEWPGSSEVHNVTFQRGDINIKVTHINRVSNDLGSSKKYSFNSQDDKWKFLELQITFNDDAEKEKHSLTTFGVYDIQRGRILSLSDSAKFHSLFAFPHYMSLDQDENLRKESFEQSKKLITEYWDTSKYIDTLRIGDLSAAYHNAQEKCEYAIFLQIDPWNQYTKDQLKMIDDELNWPLGRPANLSDLPPISISSGLFFSPDCGVSLKLDNVRGPRYELQTKKVRYHLLCGVILIMCQIYLLLCQMKHTNTPSSVNKISFYSFRMINLVDGILAMVYFIASSIVAELYLPLVISAFCSFILASLFETRYLIAVYASQANEEGISIRTLFEGNTEGPERQRVIPEVPDEAAISGGIYGRFFFFLVTFSFLAISAPAWPRNVRLFVEYTGLFILNSYWVPQILRNAVKGIPARNIRRRNENARNRGQTKLPLLWKFVVGTTIIRVLPVIYIFTYPSNIFKHHKNVKFVVLLSLWLLFQVSILYSQDILGARWFLPQHTIPEGYSYFKSVTSQYLAEHGDESLVETNSVDCSICMSGIPLYVDDKPETHKVDQYSYMVTPCNHIFHTECLENWMSYKLQCPVCRTPLPPV